MTIYFIAGQALLVLVVFVAIKYRTSIENASNKILSGVIRVCCPLSNIGYFLIVYSTTFLVAIPSSMSTTNPPSPRCPTNGQTVKATVPSSCKASRTQSAGKPNLAPCTVSGPA